jgi:hypothetical protein
VAIDRLAAHLDEVRRRSLTVAGAAQVGDAIRIAPVSRFTGVAARLHSLPAPNARGSVSTERRAGGGTGGRCYHRFMLDELQTLGGKLTELAGLVRALREENHSLRQQLATAKAELAETRGRVDSATRRIDALVERLAADTGVTRN